jgi:ribosome-associated toxin RatA of RatAB toxin-antitoxin module
VRVKTIETKWTFTPLADGKVRLEYQIKSDPAGSIPKWLFNLAADEAPVRSMLALKKLLANYHNAHVDFIKD